MKRNWQRYSLAALVAAMGMTNIISALLAREPGRIEFLRRILPLDLLHGTRTLTVLAGGAMLFLAYGLLRRKRAAWRLVVLMLVISIISHIVKGLDYEEAMGDIIVLLLLWPSRSQFTARSDRPSVRRGLLTVAGALLFTYFYGIWGFYLLDGQFNVNFELSTASAATLRHFFNVDDPGVYPLRIPSRGSWFLWSLDVVGLVSIGYAFFMVLRPVIMRRSLQFELERDRKQAREIVLAYGKSSLARLVLLADKHYHFTPSGNGVIGYVQIGNVSLTLGDPIGSDQGVEEVTRSFIEMCKANDWHPALYHLLPDYLPLYRSLGLRTLKIGEEAVITTECFSIEGKRWKSERNLLNRLVKAGYVTKVYDPPIPPALLAKLRVISDAWLRTMRGGEKRFSLGWFDPTYLSTCPIIVAETPEGDPVAFANIYTEYQRNNLTIDLMRYGPANPPGIMDFLIVNLIEYARENGFEGFNLGLAPLSGVGGTTDAAPTERAVHYLYEHFNRFYSFMGLRAFKEKFTPAWEPRYIAYEHDMLLPKIALTIVRADTPGSLSGFWGRDV